ncbi:MAG: polysaccharide lyase 6 family protein [Phycisphaerae bacterium]|nr:polysaccharide lyase 6 family protein [Phycisphaerae bacterium]
MNTSVKHPLTILIYVSSLLLLMASQGNAQTLVSSAESLTRALLTARPGDEIVIQNGTYQDWVLDIGCSGSAERRLVVRAETPGQAILTGDSRMRISGDHVTVAGLCFKDGQATSEIWQVTGSFVRITDCALVNYKDGGRKWIRMYVGRENRLDHNMISGKTEKDVTLQIDVSESGELNHHRIDHNVFGPRARGQGNGWETIRNGYSHQQNNPAHNLFEHNLFYACDGENEIISSKSSYNTYQYNTFRNCAGELTLRHGKYNRVEGNFFFGEGKRGSAGIRIIGEGHRVVNNYIENTRGIGIQIYEGEGTAQATGYQAANDVLVAFNTIVRNRGNGINVRDYERTPRHMVIANNLVVGNVSAVSRLTPAQLSESYALVGNMAWDNPIEIPAPETAFRLCDPALSRDATGVLRPGPDSSVVGRAVSLTIDIKTDLDGQVRANPMDVGADQVNGTGDTINRPLAVTDIGIRVGPSWTKDGSFMIEPNN